MHPQAPVQLPYLPVIKDSQQALALTQKHNDLFYLFAYQIQVWMGELLTDTMDEYINKPNPADRVMQTGQSWHSFECSFGTVCDEEFHLVVSFFMRYAASENPVSRNLMAAWVMLFHEHRACGDFLGPKDIELLGKQPHRDVPRLRRSVQRLCDWLDAVVQINVHKLYYMAPGCFAPEPQTRERAFADVAEPVMAELEDPDIVFPYVQPASPAPRFNASSAGSAPAANPLISQSAKVAPGAPAAVKPEVFPRGAHRPWPFPKLDEAIITFWPLLKRHNWTYADLWNVLDQGGLELASTSCANHRWLAHYCLHTLGLRKTGHGQTTRNGLPPGHELAHHLLRHFKARSRPLGRGPWS